MVHLDFRDKSITSWCLF